MLAVAQRRVRRSEAVDANRAKVGERGKIGLQRRELLAVGKPDHHVGGPVAIDLQRQHRPRGAEGAEQFVLTRERPHGRNRLLHLAVDELPLLASERDWHYPRAGPQPHARAVPLLRDDKGGAEHGVAGERQLVDRREDPDGCIPASSSPGNTKTVSDRWSFLTRSTACIRRLGTASPSVNTASWFPASGVSVKTSMTV